MTKKPIFMRANKELLEEIKKCKLTPRESYAEVVKRLINRDAKYRKRFD